MAIKKKRPSPPQALQLLRGIGAQQVLARQASPACHVDYKDRDPRGVPRNEVAPLFATAPTDFSRALLARVLLERQLSAAERGQKMA